MEEAATLWTLDELAERVGAALSVGYHGQASGRVREVPDQRVIRYYTTLGLVDRAAARRGSVALYGRRHLLQLVAIKKLQARGLPLARIQVELAGATDERLERIANLPRPEGLVASRAATYAAGRTGAFWRREAAADPAAATPTSDLLGEGPRVAMGPLARSQRPAAGAGPPAEGTLAGEGSLLAEGEQRGEGSLPAGAGSPAQGEPRGEAERHSVTTLQGVRLADGVTLLLDQVRPLRQDDVHSIQAAAARLLEALRARGLDGGPRGREPR